MSSTKEEWKESGTNLGHAFKGFGKTFVRSVKHVVDKTDEKINKEEETVEIINEDGTVEACLEKDTVVNEGTKDKKEKEETVFNDGSWRQTGKDLGKAALGMGKTLGHTFRNFFKGEPKEEEKNEEK